MNDDRVLMRGLAFYGYHGVMPEETKLGQRFLVDIEMSCDTRAAGRTDDLTQTVDYVAVHRDVRRIVEGEPHKLIETVAERIASKILGDYRVEAVRVRVLKPDVPLAATLDYVGVDITRHRGAKAGA